MTGTTMAAPRRIMFSVRNLWYLKFYDAVFRELAARGHTVLVVADRGEGDEKVADWTAAMDALTREHPGITLGWAPSPAGTTWAGLSLWIRRCLDYLRYLEPQFLQAPVLRRRAAVRAPAFLRWAAGGGSTLTSRAAALLTHRLSRLDRAIAPTATLEEFLRAQRPDVVLITPLVTLGSTQFDMLRAARRLGIPTALGVGSWDHLSSKALIRVVPDRVFVWNETQRREAVEFHGVPAERVAVTGAQCFDQWFEMAPSRDRDAFCREVGLPADKPILLYVCSALFEGSPNEAEFVRQWVTRVRASSDPLLAAAAILVRPHPKRGFEWANVDLSGVPDVAVWPPLGQAPLDTRSKSAYFDSLFHSTAVVGLNTSALIEGGVIGRPVYTILLPEFWDNQEGTLHFHYLLNVEGGLLNATRGFDEHLAQLADGLRRPEAVAARSRAFVEAFVRPHGIARRATPIFADTVEQLTALTPSPVHDVPAWAPAARLVMWPLAMLLRIHAPGTETLWRKQRYAEKQQQRAAEKAAALARREQQREAARREREAQSAAKRGRAAAAKAQRAAEREREDARRRRRKRLGQWRARVGGYYRRFFPRHGEQRL